MSTTTTNFSWILPGVNDPTDQDLWGGYLNSNITSQDGVVFAALNFVNSDQTSTFTVTTADYKKLFLCDATSGAITVNLPAAATTYDGFTVAVKRINSGSNAVTIDPNASELIDGASTLSLGAQYDVAVLVSNGTGWSVVSSIAPAASETVAGVIEIATQAEIETGSSNVLAVTPGRLKGAIGFSNGFESAAIPLAAGTTASAAHGLGARPIFYGAYLRCKTTGQTFTAGEEIAVASYLFPGGGVAALPIGVTVKADATNIYLTVGSGGGSATGISLLDASGNAIQITLANFEAYLRAWA